MEVFQLKTNTDILSILTYPNICSTVYTSIGSLYRFYMIFNVNSGDFCNLHLFKAHPVPCPDYNNCVLPTYTTTYSPLVLSGTSTPGITRSIFKYWHHSDKGALCMAWTGIIFCVRPANERRRYNVTSSLIGWAHTQNYPCMWWLLLVPSMIYYTSLHLPVCNMVPPVPVVSTPRTMRTPAT